MPRAILVVEDDVSIRRGLVDTLACAGYHTHESGDGVDALQRALALDVDAALIDVMLPKMDGFALLEEIRRSKPSLPVIMVTARGAESERVRGLKGGADDYVVKPFSALELLARVEAVLRRSAERPTTVGTFDVAGRRVDLEQREIRFPDGHVRTLSEKEAELLQYLASCRGRTISREELLQRVWGLDPKGVETRTIDMHVARLRDKFEHGPEEELAIRTIRGKGYVLA